MNRQETCFKRGRLGNVHVFYVLETVAEVANEGMVDMLEHAALSNDVPYAFGSDDCGGARTRSVRPANSNIVSEGVTGAMAGTNWLVSKVLRTFIFAYVLEGEGETSIFPLDDADLAKRTTANDA